MARRRKHARRARQYANNDLAEREPIPQLSPETRHGIVVVALFACGVLSALALAGIAGAAGAQLADGLRALFGAAAFLVPIVLLIIAALLLREAERRPRFGALQLLGFLLLAVSMTGLLHVFGADGPLTSHPLGAKFSDGFRGGGYLGLVLAKPLLTVFGITATTVILFACTIIGIFLGFHLSFEHLRAMVRAVAGAARAFTLSVRAVRSSSVDDDREQFTERTLPEDEEGEAREEEHDDEAPTTDDTPPTAHNPADVLAAPARKRHPRRPKVDIPLDLLSNEVGKPTSGDIKAAQAIIQQTLQHFRIAVEMSDVRVGPTVTQFTLRPADGVKLSRITALAPDLALALAAHPIRIEAPIPGKSLVGIEVPNQKVAVVRLREILESHEFAQRQSPLTIALGKDVAGHVWTADVSRMPHLLVAGATGSGKSVMLNAIIVSLLFQNGPDDLRLILVDPKRVEFPVFNGIPHLLTPVITDVKKTVHALQWMVAEMDRRFELLAARRKRDLASYNRACRTDEDRLPYLVIIIDELADLMAVAAREVEGAIIRLAQMARAVGIHLIVATQRPSVDVITGLIKANITARIAFAVASSTDSRTILDGVGAEKLLGRGDMLFTTAELSKPKRVQGAFVSDREIQRIVEHLTAHGGGTNTTDVITERPIVAFRDPGTTNEDHDDLLPDARDVLREAGKASASLLQRRLKIGYARAARILDILEEQGFIGPADGAKPREVYGQMDDTPMQPTDTPHLPGVGSAGAGTTDAAGDGDGEDDDSEEVWEDGDDSEDAAAEEDDEEDGEHEAEQGDHASPDRKRSV